MSKLFIYVLSFLFSFSFAQDKGIELFNDKKYSEAIEYYKKALALNPNDALTHIEYAYYFQLRPNPNIKKFLEHLTISQQLDPISWLQAGSYMRALIFNNKLKEAEAFLEKNKFQ